jgi:hypothetical protein
MHRKRLYETLTIRILQRRLEPIGAQGNNAWCGVMLEDWHRNAAALQLDSLLGVYSNRIKMFSSVFTVMASLVRILLDYTPRVR